MAPPPFRHRHAAGRIAAVALATLLALVLALAPAVRAAAPSPAPVDAPADRETFDALVERARAAREAGRLEDALAALERAWALSHSASVLNNIAVTLTALGRYDEALDAARRLADHADVPVDRRAAVIAQRDDLEARAARAWLQILADPGVIPRVGDVTAEPGAELAVDPGLHAVSAQLANGDVARIAVTARRGRRVTVDLTVAAVSRDLGALDVAALAAPDLTLDGARWPTAPAGDRARVWLPPGSYAVAIAGGPPRTVSVQAGTVTRLGAAPSDDGPGAAPWIVGGLGLAALAAGAVLAVDADARRDDLRATIERAQGAPVDGIGRGAALDEEDAANDQSTVAAAAIGVGAILCVSAVVWLMLADDDGPPDGIEVLPALGLTTSAAGAAPGLGGGLEVRW